VGPDFAVFPSAFDAFVTVLVKIGKVLPKLLVGSIDNVSVLDGSEPRGQVPDCGDVKLVLVGLSRKSVSVCSTMTAHVQLETGQ
jgi:hypothetical protein